MPVLERIEITFQPDPGQYSRATKRATKAAHEAMGWYWWRKQLPSHFKIGARGRYGYKPRKRKTRDRKRRLAKYGKVRDGGRLALVWTGAMREQMRDLPPTVRAFPARATVRMRAPSYVKINPVGNRPNLYREATKVHPSEKQQLAKVAQQTTEKELKSQRGGSKYKVIVKV